MTTDNKYRKISIFSLRYKDQKINIISDSTTNAKFKFMELHQLHKDSKFSSLFIVVINKIEVIVKKRTYTIKKESMQKDMSISENKCRNYYEHREKICKCYNKKV